MPVFFYQLGNTPDLSYSELAALVPATQLSRFAQHLASVELPSEEDAYQLLEKLGGTVKVFTHLKTIPAHTKPEEVQDEVVRLLMDILPGAETTTFNVAELGRDHLPPLSLPEIKHELKKEGVVGHYRSGSRSGLSASVLLHHKLVEIVVASTAQGIVFGQTIGIQDIDDWTVRDRSKPYADRKKGMLPPKVARMMVNLALGTTAADAQKRVYDPYCGSGTVLFEAALRGFSVIGSDLDPAAVQGTRANLDWFSKTYPETAHLSATLFIADAARVTLNEVSRPVEFIVTEPFLGKQTPQPAQLPNIFRGLHKQYWSAFRAWSHFLADEAKVVIVFPLVTVDQTTYSLESLIDKLAPLGYTISSDPILYHRPMAVIQRQIMVFSFKKPQVDTEITTK